MEQREEMRKEKFGKTFLYLSEIFPLRGLHFKTFTHKKIKFQITPYDIDRKFHHPSEKRTITLYNNPKYKWWSLRRMTTGAKDQIMEVFKKRIIRDKNLRVAIEDIYDIIEDEISWTTMDREEKSRILKRGGLHDEDIFLSEVEQKILLTPEEQIAFQAKRAKIDERLRRRDEWYKEQEEVASQWNRGLKWL